VDRDASFFSGCAMTFRVFDKKLELTATQKLFHSLL